MNSRTTDAFVLTWHSGPATGFADILPRRAFREHGRRGRFVHLVRSPRGKLSAATCTLTVKKGIARLDYNPFQAENTTAGMDLGEMRISFEDATRSCIAAVEWADGTTRVFNNPEITRDIEEEVAWPTYRPTKGRRSGKLRKVTERPGQATFRAQLMIVYGSRCCMSGCNVAEALDGAHIDPYENPSYDSPHNGLLLRRDLHALFDANLLCVSPRTNTVLVAARLKASAEYGQFHGKRIATPAIGFSSVAPDGRAIRRRYGRFEG